MIGLVVMVIGVWMLVWVARVIEEHTESSGLGFLGAIVLGVLAVWAWGMA